MSNQTYTEDAFEVAIYEDQEVIFDDSYEPWMTQAQMAALLGIHRDNVTQILSRAGKKDPEYGTTIDVIAVGQDGKQRLIKHYNLDALLYVGFRAETTQAVKAFRRWVANIVRNHLQEEIMQRERRIQRLEGALENANVRAHEATSDLEARLAYELEMRYPEEFYGEQ